MRALLSIIILGAIVWGIGAAAPAGAQGIISNPLGNRTLPQIVADLMTGLRDIAIPIAVILVLYGGFQIMTAGGNPQKFEEGKKTLLYTAAGLAVILLAQTIADVIKSIIQGS